MKSGTTKTYPVTTAWLVMNTATPCPCKSSNTAKACIHAMAHAPMAALKQTRSACWAQDGLVGVHMGVAPPLVGSVLLDQQWQSTFNAKLMDFMEVARGNWETPWLKLGFPMAGGWVLDC